MTYRSSIAVIAVVTLLLSVITSPVAATHDVTPARVEGADRIATAAAAARLAYPDGTRAAVLSRAGDWPDALAGAPLAGVIGGPLLLTWTDELPATTAQALEDLGVEEMVLLGGPQAISYEVEQQLAETYAVVRIAGVSRYGTAAAVAREIAQRGDIGATPGGMRSAFLASGTTFADALAAGAPAALGLNRMPLLLTEPDELPGATSAALDDLPIEQVLIAGGVEAVSQQVADELEQRGLNVVRFAGATRTETAAELADFAVDILPATPTVVHLARADVFADALAAGPLAARLEGPLLLATGPDLLGDAAGDWLAVRCPGVMVVRAVGGTAAISTAVLEEAEQAAQSCHPPTARLAYLSRTGDPLRLITTTLPGGDVTVVAGDVEPTGGYDWSPDGEQFVYARFLAGQQGATELVILDADGSNPRVLTSAGTDDRYPEFSPDGQRIAFTRGPTLEPESGLWVVDADGSDLQQLVDEPDAEPLFPVWSPDGLRIAYERFPDAGEPQIAVIDADGGEPQVIAERGVRPTWSPDGELLAFVRSQAPGDLSTALHVISPDGTGLRELASSAAGTPVWSPDGQLIAFSTPVAEDPGSTDLSLVGRDGTGQRVLADVRALDGDPSWSPDGSTVAFVAAQVEGDSDVYVIGVGGEGLRPLTTSGDAESPHFAPA